MCNKENQKEIREDIKFSIVMPAYNTSKYIRPAIESVLSQTYENWQLVVVDDGSTDDTLAIAGEYAKKDERNRIIVIHQENSGTAAAARNTALEYIMGDYVQMLDSDDYISSDMLEKYAEIINEGQNVPTIISPVALSVSDDGQINREISHASQYIGRVIDGQKAFELSLNWTIHGIVCVCADLMKRIQFDPLLVNGDEFTTRKLFANAAHVTFVDTTYFYRDNLESTTKSSANRCRMYEALITDGNIYKYAVAENMDESLRSRCAKKWDKSLIAHEAQFLRDVGKYDDAGARYAEGIINKNLEEIHKLQVAMVDSSIYGIVVRWCKGKRTRLIVAAHIYNLFWRIKKHE